MKRGVLKRALCGGLAAVMVLSMAACGGGTGTTAVNSTEEKTTEAKASGEQKVIKFMHRFPDEPYNSFI